MYIIIIITKTILVNLHDFEDWQLSGYAHQALVPKASDPGFDQLLTLVKISFPRYYKNCVARRAIPMTALLWVQNILSHTHCIHSSIIPGGSVN